MFLSCTHRERGDTVILSMEGKLSVQIAAPEDKIACTLGKQKNCPERV